MQWTRLSLLLWHQKGCFENNLYNSFCYSAVSWAELMTVLFSYLSNNRSKCFLLRRWIVRVWISTGGARSHKNHRSYYDKQCTAEGAIFYNSQVSCHFHKINLFRSDLYWKLIRIGHNLILNLYKNSSLIQLIKVLHVFFFQQIDIKLRSCLPTKFISVLFWK